MRRRPPLAMVAPLVSCVVFAGLAAFDPGLRAAPPRGPLPASEEGEVLLSLARYQQVYQDFFARGGSPEFLDEFPATKGMRHQVFRDLGFVRDAGLVQVQDLATATLVETRWAGKDAAEATVYEEWNYVFQKAQDRTPASALKGLGQGFRYGLVRSAGRWVVASCDPIPMEPPSGEGVQVQPW